MITSDADSHQGENWRGNEEGSKIERKVATFLQDDTVSEQVKDAFSSQVLLGWEDAFQGREDQQLYNTMEETVSRGESVE